MGSCTNENLPCVGEVFKIVLVSVYWLIMLFTTLSSVVNRRR